MHRSTTTSARLRKVVAAAAMAVLAASGVAVAVQAAQAAPPPAVVINEVESSNAVTKDWVELKNVGADPVDVSGWIVKDDNDSRVKAIPAGTTIAPGGDFTFTVDEAPNGFGLAVPTKRGSSWPTAPPSSTAPTGPPTPPTPGAAAPTAPARSP